MLATAFAFVALLLAVLGVYGVLAYQVSQRTREIGLRDGARRRRSTHLSACMGEGAVVIGAGKVIGLLGATLLRQTIEAQLYGTGAMEPEILIVASGVLVIVSLLATAIPAGRAARTDPTTALSHV